MRNQVEKIINMVNLVTAYCSMLRWGMMKIAGVRPYTVEIEPGTVMRFWVPSETPLKPKPVVVLLHGFCGDGIMTWQFQVCALTKNYAVYVPDFLFFGSSGTDRPERSVAFQAECLAAGLRKLGVEKCIVVGFSYGGMVAFNMAEMYPELVQAVVVSGSCVAIVESIITTVVEEAGYSSCSDMLLPTSVEGLRALLSIGAHKNLAWFPNRFYRDFLEVMYSNREERCELLDELVTSYKEISIPKFQQQIHLLWGANDKLFKVELAKKMKEKLGSKATFQVIKEAGHLVHLERPFVYNRCLKQFLSSVMPLPEALKDNPTHMLHSIDYLRHYEGIY